MPTDEGFSGVSNCYVFKSRLQEYAQKVGLPALVYETMKEGPSHEPSFRSTVIVNDVRYDSLPGFFNRKAAEQSAAEVALVELAKRGEVSECISQPVHETGLCKNLLQEYAQKMNYAIPLYQCQKDEAPGKVQFTCTVEIGGIRYIGAAAKTKKEAEIKAARTALLAIQELSGKSVGNSQLTVIPCRKRPAELANNGEETLNVPKAKKSRFKKKMLKMKHNGGRTGRMQVQGLVKSHSDHKGSKMDQTNTSGFELVSAGLFATEATRNCQEGRSVIAPIEREIPVVNDALPHCVGGETGSESVHSASANCNQDSNETPVMDTSSVLCGRTAALVKEVNEATFIVGASSVSYRPTTASLKELNEATPDVGGSTVFCGLTFDLAKKLNEATPNVSASFVSYRCTTAFAKESNDATLDLGTSYVSNGPAIALAKELNEVAPKVSMSSVLNGPTSTLAKELKEVTPDVGTCSLSYEPITASAKEVKEATGVIEATSMMNSSTTTLAEESNEANPDVGTSLTSYEPRTALAKEVNETTEVKEAASMMNSSILGQMESSCVIPGVNQSEERVQAGTSQA